MSKLNLDKYYTPEYIATRCIDTALSLIPEPTEIVEPSAGDGSFSNQIQGCIAYDIAPGCSSVLQQDFLSLDIEYKKGRLVIGNPPFGPRNTLSVKFFKKSVTISDYVAFILPISQYENTQQMYEFDLIHSEILPRIEYSGIPVNTCFNVYTRPANGLLNTHRIDYSLKDVLVKEYRRGGNYPIPENFDFCMNTYGHSLGKEVSKIGTYCQENYIIIHNDKHRNKILEVMRNTDWKHLYPFTSTPKIQTWKIYKYLKESIPELE